MSQNRKNGIKKELFTIVVILGIGVLFALDLAQEHKDSQTFGVVIDITCIGICILCGTFTNIFSSKTKALAPNNPAPPQVPRVCDANRMRNSWQPVGPKAAKLVT